MMFWHSCFGSMRYRWIHDKVREEYYLPPSEERAMHINSILIKIMDTWDPASDELYSLFLAIEGRQSGSPIFPLSLICRCIESIHFDGKDFQAWRIIGVMLKRRIDTELYCCTKTIQFLENRVNILHERSNLKNQSMNEIDRNRYTLSQIKTVLSVLKECNKLPLLLV
jgi:hypothetical protein